jgi:hypothetical protein
LCDVGGLWTPLSSLSRFRFLPASTDNSILSSFMRNLAVCNNVMLMPNQATGELNVTDKESLKKCLEVNVVLLFCSILFCSIQSVSIEIV